MLLFLEQKKFGGMSRLVLTQQKHKLENISYFLPNIVSLVYKINKAYFYYIVWSHRFNGVGIPYM